MKKLIGKTITSAEIMQKADCDDRGWLKLTFSDGTTCVLEGGYGGYTGGSVDEYPTYIKASFDKKALVGLIPANK